MALSEHEQRLLDEMERNLYRHDADFVASVSGARQKPNYRFIALGVLLALAGLGLLVTAVTVHLVLLGVLGFVALLIGVLLAMRTSPTDQAPASQGANTARRPARSSFMDRMNERWDRRHSG